MDFLRAQFSRIQQQLAGLNASQKMLAGTLAVIMVMTLFWWGTFASKAEMEPLLSRDLSADEIGAVTARLRALGITARVDGYRVLVPSERKMEAWADLSYTQILSRDTGNAVKEMLDKISPFATGKLQNEMLNQAKETMLGQWMQLWPSVSHAMVAINNPGLSNPGLIRGPGALQPSATVQITLRPGHVPDEKLVNAAADTVAGAANVARSRIKVIVNGASQRVRDRDDLPYGDSDEWLSAANKAETHYSEKLSRHFSWIEGVMVSVSVKPNFQRVETIDHKVDPKNVFQKAISEETLTDETQSSQRPPGEPGVASNAGMSLTDVAPAGDATSGTSEKSKTDFVVDKGTSDIKTLNPGGDLVVTGASVLIPRSYFVQVYKRMTGTADKEPDPTALGTFIQAEVAKMKPAVKSCLPLIAEDAVHVAEYVDLMPSVATAPQLASTSVASVSLMVTDHVKEIALGALALISLLVVSNMVKKGNPGPVIAEPEPPKPPQTLVAGEEAVGEAIEGEAFLDGMEVDEDSVKAQHMLKQVSTMVEENPDAAASLVKRWLNRS